MTQTHVEEARRYQHLMYGGPLERPAAPVVIETHHEPSFYNPDTLNPIPGVGQFRYIKSYDDVPTAEETGAAFAAWAEANPELVA